MLCTWPLTRATGPWWSCCSNSAPIRTSAIPSSTPLRPAGRGTPIGRSSGSSSRSWRSARERRRLEVPCLPVVPRQPRERPRLDDGRLEVLAGEGADGVERVEARERDEGHLAVLVAAEDVGAAEALDRPHRREELVEQEALVRVGV